jgi:ADP-ribose pyrophosphatase
MAFFHTTPGFCDESMHVFRATGLVASKAKGDEDERIEVQAFSLPELEAMIDSGDIREGKTLVAILLEGRRHR